MKYTHLLLIWAAALFMTFGVLLVNLHAASPASLPFYPERDWHISAGLVAISYPADPPCEGCCTSDPGDIEPDDTGDEQLPDIDSYEPLQPPEEGTAGYEDAEELPGEDYAGYEYEYYEYLPGQPPGLGGGRGGGGAYVALYGAYIDNNRLASIDFSLRILVEVTLFAIAILYIWFFILKPITWALRGF